MYNAGVIANGNLGLDFSRICRGRTGNQSSVLLKEWLITGELYIYILNEIYLILTD